MKWRVKQAAGALTGDKKLKHKGKVDQAVGKTKKTVEKAIDEAADSIRFDDRGGSSRGTGFL